MSSDPVTSLLAGLELSVEPRLAFAAELRGLLLEELERPARRLGRTLLLTAAALLLLTGIASATYLVVHRVSATSKPGPGSLTVLESPGNGVSKVAEVLPGGRTRIVWRCPTNTFCGELTSFDWSPDGKRAAFTLDEIGGMSNYVGLHILNLKTGRDLHLPAVPTAAGSVFIPEEKARLGCLFPTQVSWSPDGRLLAYSCTVRAGATARGAIFTIRADGSTPTELVTGLRSVAWPSWSPDGRRVAFDGLSNVNGRPAVYVIGLDGSGRRLLARDAKAPSWSPDGKTIAIEPSRGGMRLVTPAGVDVTPSRGLGPAGLPAWSRDGSLLAVATPTGIYLVDPAGAHRRRVTSLSGQTPAFGQGRPAWVPGPSTLYRTPACASCL